MDAEYNRQLQHMIIDGKVSAVDHATWQCKVKSDQLETDWMPMPTQRAGKAHIWSPLEVGEQVTFACLNGDPNHARIVASFFTDSLPPKDAKEGYFHINFENGDFLTHDDEGNFTLETTKTFKVKAKDIEMIAEESYKIKTKAFELIADETAVIDASSDIDIKSGAKISAKAHAQATFESSTIAVLKSPQNFSDAPITYLAGGLSQGTPPPAATSVASRMARAIDYSIRLLGTMFVQNIEAQGYIKAKNDITSDSNMIINTLDGKIKLKEHTHSVEGDVTGEPKRE